MSMRLTSKLTALLFYMLLIQPATAQVWQHTIYFSSNSYQLSNADKTKLKELSVMLITNPSLLTISTTGNTDNQGSGQFNLELSRKRANAVSNYFLSTGIPADKLIVDFAGENNPVGNNETAEGRQQNRRVDIFISFKTEDPVTVEEEKAKPAGDIGEIYAMLKTPLQEFCIDITKDTFLVGEKGTIVEYKANTIKRESVSCKCLTLRLNEYFTKSDMLLNNLTTTSDGLPLESGGMIKLEAYCDGKLVNLEDGKSLTVMVPTDIPLAGMKLLSANRQNDSDYLNWKIVPPGDDVDYFNLERMLLRCGFAGGQGPGSKCHFFFCRIANLFRNMNNKKGAKVNARLIEELKKESDLLSKYELEGEPLEVALRSSKEKAGVNALNYYVYKKYNWDYNNLDRFMKVTKAIDFVVKNDPDKETDVKLVYKTSKTVVPAFQKKTSYLFDNVQNDALVWIVGLKFTADKKIMLGLKEISTVEKSVTLEFKEVTLDELKIALKKLD